MLLLQTAAAGADLLEPDRAFRFSARLVGPELIEVRYRIADGYYMYRDKFRFSATPEAVVLGAPELPPGKILEDEFFGRVETYRRDLTIRIALKGAANLKFFTLTAVSQGCADVGVCYVPLTQTIRLRRGGLPLSEVFGTWRGPQESTEAPARAWRPSVARVDIPGGRVEALTEPALSTDARV